MNPGRIYVIVAPSGAGKSTLVNALCKVDPNVQLSVSHTTRIIRPGEKNGINYFFISIDQFESMIKNKEFLEYAKVYDNYYGTNITTIKDFLATGKDIILEIDFQGAQQVRKLFSTAVLIFIMPPSLETLKQRLVDRKTDTSEVIEKRLAHAMDEIKNAPHFDYLVINDTFEVALQDLCSIIRAERNKTEYMLELIKPKLNF